MLSLVFASVRECVYVQQEETKTKNKIVTTPSHPLRAPGNEIRMTVHNFTYIHALLFNEERENGTKLFWDEWK